MFPENSINLIYMTSEQKQQIYSLLKTASDSILGYKSKSFDENAPFFKDDEKIQLQEKQQPQQKIQPQENTKSSNQILPQSMQNVIEKIAQCSRCPLAKTRHNTVPGTGVSSPFVLVIGEGPGFEEDMQGLPFVGPAGQLLDKMLAAINLSRISNVYIANIVKCRPPQNRNPYPEEADACSSFLQAQIALLKPKAILCVGTVAAKNLLKTEFGVTKLRGQFFEYQNIPVCVTYHPSALLRDNSLKRLAWEDLKFFKTKLLELNPGYESQYIPYVKQ